MDWKTYNIPNRQTILSLIKIEYSRKINFESDLRGKNGAKKR